MVSRSESWTGNRVHTASVLYSLLCFVLYLSYSLCQLGYSLDKGSLRGQEEDFFCFEFVKLSFLSGRVN